MSIQEIPSKLQDVKRVAEPPRIRMDVPRMAVALESKSYVLPSGVSRDEMRRQILAVASGAR